MTDVYRNIVENDLSDTWGYKVTKSLLAGFEERLSKINDEDDHEQSRWFAPFQFTIPICAAIYHDILSDDIYVKKGQKNEGWQLSSFFESKRRNGEKEGYDLNWHFPDPLFPKEAKGTAIRAVEFLSWEESTRLFLARRLYPTFFDFISYSSCHENWGAVGHMIDKIRTDGYQPFAYDDNGFSQRSLPFLAESKRLQYGAIFTIPVLDSVNAVEGKPVASNFLHGAFVCFMQKNDYRPWEKFGKNQDKLLKLKEYFKYMSSVTSEILRMQSSLLNYNSDPGFEEVWKSVKGAKIYEVKINFDDEIINPAEFSRSLLSQLALSDQFVIEDPESRVRTNYFRFLMAPSHFRFQGNENSKKDGISFCKSRITDAVFRINGRPDSLNIEIRPVL